MKTESSVAEDPVPDPGRRRWILAALMMAMMLAAMDTTIVSTAIPQIVADLGGFALFGWVFSVYLLAQTVTIPLYGKRADTFGRKPVLVIGIVIFLAGSVASAMAWNMVALIGFRALQGLGAGTIMATVNTLAGDLYSVRERARVQGWLSSVWGVAAILGPTLGGAFAEYAEVARRVQELYPEIPVVLLTGYSASADAARREGFEVLRKPLDAGRIEEVIEAKLSRRIRARARE